MDHNDLYVHFWRAAGDNKHVMRTKHQMTETARMNLVIKLAAVKKKYASPSSVQRNIKIMELKMMAITIRVNR